MYGHKTHLFHEVSSHITHEGHQEDLLTIPGRNTIGESVRLRPAVDVEQIYPYAEFIKFSTTSEKETLNIFKNNFGYQAPKFVALVFCDQ